jgi:predicted RNA methylase
VASEIKYLNLAGRTLRYWNPDGLYPVNQYQSLVLAAITEYVAAVLSGTLGLPLSRMSAWEPCCGGGPVAVALKSLGVGHVQATDLNEDALEACRANAARNGLQLDCVKAASMLDDGSDRRYELISCNPPCGVTPGVAPDQDAITQAISGGGDGMGLTELLLRQSSGRLSRGGSLVLVVVSTGDVRGLARRLDELFPARWRVMPATPVAAPYALEGDPRLAVLRDPNLGFRPVLWQRPDGWYWRLSWVVEAFVGRDPLPRTGFPLCPLGFDVARDPALSAMVERLSTDGFWLTV